MSRRRDPLWQDLFSWAPPKATVSLGAEGPGRGALDSQIARLVSRALREAREEGASRADVARRIATTLGRSVSEATLDKWASEAAEEHRIPLDAFLALVEATGCNGLLGALVERFGFVVVEARYADLIELHLVEEQQRKMDAHRCALEARWRARR
ncbi:hypothetical protein [Polymorphum gilvum]|uniref:Uncharacterized protein n=1 Tax=Polymorphum gilvum (strain LMG 25793 / CGMCC 1.9160 / SL003B-26A1) TaxID=991905 RepID=F2J666_POLGS|nr:hypothetical protein [Polymorphum gilvum]ADZ72429.1 hypothetical protein SL003B_4010 [Polymorphum gilvum SL003B-26A1]